MRLFIGHHLYFLFSTILDGGTNSSGEKLKKTNGAPLLYHASYICFLHASIKVRVSNINYCRNIVKVRVETEYIRKWKMKTRPQFGNNMSILNYHAEFRVLTLKKVNAKRLCRKVPPVAGTTICRIYIWVRRVLRIEHKQYWPTDCKHLQWRLEYETANNYTTKCKVNHRPGKIPYASIGFNRLPSSYELSSVNIQPTLRA